MKDLLFIAAQNLILSLRIIQQKQIMYALTCIYLLYIVVPINILH